MFLVDVVTAVAVAIINILTSLSDATVKYDVDRLAG